MSDLGNFLTNGRAFFSTGNRYSVADRRAMLRKLEQALRTKRGAIMSALHCDLRKSEAEATVSEYLPLLDVLKTTRRKLGRWAARKWRATAVCNWPARSFVVPEPYGMVLVVGTWNYPLLLALEPLIGALAAGNRVVLKLSEQSPATAHIIVEIVESCFDKNEAWIVPSSFDLKTVLGEQFDYIFFTGGAKAGRAVAEAAAEYLTPVTLELGGKNPVIVDVGANIDITARRIVWGKFMNAGQTCTAPDYILVHRNVKKQLLNALRGHIRKSFGDDPQVSSDYGRIVNDDHFERLRALLGKGRLIAGGEFDRQELYIAPTVLDDVTWDDPVMGNEIFGPVLPVMEFESLPLAIAAVNAKDKPLALYYFGKQSGAERVIASTSSGAVAVNDTVMHYANSALPFGGVGKSGMGRYHGRYTFDTFSHEKPVMKKPFWGELPLRYPPFGPWMRKLIRFLAR